LCACAAPVAVTGSRVVIATSVALESDPSLFGPTQPNSR
jgi:hypothetical protein